MKFNKFMFAALTLGAMAFAACDPQGGGGEIDPKPHGGGGDDESVVEEVPEVPAPAAGHVTLVINIPEGSECNGVAFKGTLNGSTWTGANEYLGEDGPASAAACIKFEKIADTKSWFKATYKLGAEPWGDANCVMAGKLCLIYTDDSSWEGQAVNWSINDEFSTADNGRSNDGNIELYGGGLLYVNVGGWQKSECLIPEDYNITVIVPAFCDEEFAIELVGSFEGWGSEPVALSKVEGNKFKATIKANANAEWKVRGQGGWDKEIQIYRAEDDPATADFDETDTWGGVPNNVLGEEKNVTVDYSDPAKYRWNVCEGVE